jgi:hypothetical protein
VEPEWDEHEQAWALALVEDEADTCRGCGQPVSETTHPDAAGGYEVPLPVVCHGCRALHHRQKNYTSEDVEDPGSYQFHTIRTWKGGGDNS